MTQLVSILIPLYNSASFFKSTLKSIIKQNYTNWECIIVDDHSTDTSYKIADEFSKKYPEKIKVYSNPSKGACSARNYAFEQSKGEYIQYLDADDQLTNNKLYEQLTLLQKNPNSIANCKWGKFIHSIENVKWSNQFINKDYEDSTEWLVDSWLGKGMAQTSTWLTPRLLIEKARKWDESLKINQDGEFFCRVLIEADKILFNENCGVYYRFGSSDSVSQKNVFSEEKAESLLNSYISYEQILNKRDDQKTKKALANNYLNFIYQYYPNHLTLIKKAEDQFKKLGFKKMWPVGGKKFQLICKLLGFKNVLKLRTLMK